MAKYWLAVFHEKGKSVFVPLEDVVVVVD